MCVKNKRILAENKKKYKRGSLPGQWEKPDNGLYKSPENR